MKNIILFSFALICLLTIPAIAQKKADLSVFGLVKIGEKLSIPKCSPTSYKEDSVCWGISVVSPDAADETVYAYIMFPYSEKPVITSTNNITAYMINDVLEGIQFYTNSDESRESLLIKLKEKYGEPTTLNEKVAQWVFDKLTVTFSYKPGFVTIDSPRNLKAKEEFFKRYNQRNKPARIL